MSGHMFTVIGTVAVSSVAEVEGEPQPRANVLLSFLLRFSYITCARSLRRPAIGSIWLECFWFRLGLGFRGL